jgi:diadenosine tetraphosphate (Ap4A) HIT family hydrolase
MEEFKNKFKIEELLIYETKHWIWSLRPVQATLGAGVLSLKRECLTFGEVNQEEFTDLYNVIKVIESTLKKTFNYDIMNYLMLMMVDKQVHYHVIPRYERTMDFAGISWKDSGWPGVPNLAGDEIDNSKLNEILDIIKENLGL